MLKPWALIEIKTEAVVHRFYTESGARRCQQRHVKRIEQRMKGDPFAYIALAKAAFGYEIRKVGWNQEWVPAEKNPEYDKPCPECGGVGTDREGRPIHNRDSCGLINV